MSFKKPAAPVVQPAPAAAPAQVAAPTAPVAASPTAPVIAPSITAAPSFGSAVGQTPGVSDTAVSKRKRQSTLLASAPSSSASNTLLGSPIK